MSYRQEKQDIEDYFIANWPYTPIYFENGESNETGEWVRLSIQHGDAFQASMGDDPAFRHIGVLFLQIFTPTDTGSGRALELADMADILFRNLVLTNLQFKVPQIKKVPSNFEWYQVNVSTDFYRGS
jgi:hypothetical protein